jgi:YidC/Oxa1 family membrane protein insertase
MLASIVDQLGHPFFTACGWLLAAFYQLIPNYAISIALVTIVVMIAVFPITRRGTRGMLRFQLLAPEIKKLQGKYKVTPGSDAGERQQLRQKLQEEQMALYRESQVSPAGGCLPMLFQLPIFLVLYETVRGLVHQTIVHGHAIAAPLYIGHRTSMYHAISAAHGQLVSFGVNLADSVHTSGIGWAKIPILAMVLVATALQYVQTRQASGRSPAAAGAQLRQVQMIVPAVLTLVYLSIPAAVTVYFIVSGLFRVVQQELMYRRDPHIRSALAQLRAQTDPG